MAFTTTTGAGGTSLIGTSGVDSTSVAGNLFPLYIGAQAANDIVVLTGTSAGIRAELGKGADSFTTGTLSASTISGNYGNDVIDAGAISKSSSLVNGNQGEDTIRITGTISDSARILGGADNDTITVGGNVTTGAIVNGNKGNDTITVSAGFGTTTSTIYGGDGNDTVTGSNTAVAFSGDKGNDTVTGSTGQDTIAGGDGNDRLLASAAIDANIDTVIGGSGVDTFGFLGNTGATGTGAVSNASVVASAGGWDTASLSASKASGTIISADIITDFTSGTGGDVIDLNGTSPYTYGGAADTTTVLAAASYYAFSGTYSSSSNTFTFSTAATGTDTLIGLTSTGVTGLVDLNNLVVLQGVVASTLNSGNFT